MAVTIQLRRDTAANWAAVNPVLAAGELGIEIDTKQIRVGDGVTPWVVLPQYTSGGGVLHFGFDFSDHPGPVELGIVPAGRVVEKVVLEVLVAFDAGQVTIGEDSAQARFLAASDSRLDLEAGFRRESGYLCPAPTTVKVYFSGPVPTVGIGRVLVYYS